MRSFSVSNSKATLSRITDLDDLPKTKTRSATRFAQSYLTGASATEEFGLLPRAVRWVSRDRSKFIIERPPKYIRFYDEEDIEIYTVASPWAVFGLDVSVDGEIKQVSIFARNYPISSMDDELYIYPIRFAVNSKKPDRISEIEMKDILQEYRTIKFFTVVFENFNVETDLFKHPLPVNLKENLPNGWESSFETLGDYFDYMQRMSLEEMNFSEFKKSDIENVRGLIDAFNIKENEEPSTAMDYIEQMF